MWKFWEIILKPKKTQKLLKICIIYTKKFKIYINFMVGNPASK